VLDAGDGGDLPLLGDQGAVGVDRLVMLAADVPNVSDTIFFPDNELFDL